MNWILLKKQFNVKNLLDLQKKCWSFQILMNLSNDILILLREKDCVNNFSRERHFLHYK